MKSHVTGIKRENEFTFVNLDFSGKVLNTRFIAAKDTTMTAELKIKTAVADDVRLGSIFTLVLDDESTEESMD